MAHKHSVYDTDAHLRIVPALRKIIGAENIKLVRGDHNSTRVTFEMPRYVDGHDMAETSIVEIHFINISSDVQNTNMDVYIASDVQLSPDSDDVVIFSWLISNNATKYDGTLSFMLCFKCLTGESLDYAWRTDTVTGVYVLESLDCVAADFEDITDILTAWEMKISGIEDRIQSVVDGKLDKVTKSTTGLWQCYSIKADGSQCMQSFTDLVQPYALCNRGAGGVVGVGAPSNETHAVPLGFADGRYVKCITGTGGNRLYGVNPQGKQVEFGAAFTNYPFTLPMRDENYTFTVGEPTAPMHPATKKYVDDIASDSVLFINDKINFETGIISVGSLPTNNIRENCLYRLGRVTLYTMLPDGRILANGLPSISNGFVDYIMPFILLYSETFPENPEPFSDNPNDVMAGTRLLCYYVAEQNDIMGFDGDSWFSISLAFESEVHYISSIDEVTSQDYIYVQLSGNEGLFYRHDGKWRELVDKSYIDTLLADLQAQINALKQ